MTPPDLLDVSRRAYGWVTGVVQLATADDRALAIYRGLGLAPPWVERAVDALPFAAIGATAAAAANGSVSKDSMIATFERVAHTTSFAAVEAARDNAVHAVLTNCDAEADVALVRVAGDLWRVVDQLPTNGRPGFAARVDAAAKRAERPLLRAWCAVDCLHAWRRDAYNALVTTAGLTGTESSLLAEACRGDAVAVTADARSLTARGLLSDARVTATGLALHQSLDDHTDRLTTTPWKLFGLNRTAALVESSAAFQGPARLVESTESHHD